MQKRNVINQIRKATRRKFAAEDKIKIVLEGLRAEISISELCRRESISPNVYYRWAKEFLEAGKNALLKESKRDATRDEVCRLKSENDSLKRALAEAVLDVQKYKKSLGM